MGLPCTHIFAQSHFGATRTDLSGVAEVLIEHEIMLKSVGRYYLSKIFTNLRPLLGAGIGFGWPSADLCVHGSSGGGGEGETPSSTRLASAFGNLHVHFQSNRFTLINKSSVKAL
jgi:hypothetical protein